MGESQEMAKHQTSEYNVKFGRIARTIEYEDADGVFRFVFDHKVDGGARGGPRTLILDVRPAAQDCGLFKRYEPTEASEQQRVSVAIKRVIEYLESCGYLVNTTGYSAHHES